MKDGQEEPGSKNEGKSNAKAISQSTSAGPSRHTKRAGVIFKTEDGTPAGILNNRRGRESSGRGRGNVAVEYSNAAAHRRRGE